MVFSGNCQKVPSPRRIKNAFEPETAFSWYRDSYQVGIPALLGDSPLDYLQDLWNFRWSFREMKVWFHSLSGTQAEQGVLQNCTVYSKKN